MRKHFIKKILVSKSAFVSSKIFFFIDNIFAPGKQEGEVKRTDDAAAEIVVDVVGEEKKNEYEKDNSTIDLQAVDTLETDSPEVSLDTAVPNLITS